MQIGDLRLFTRPHFGKLFMTDSATDTARQAGTTDLELGGKRIPVSEDVWIEGMRPLLEGARASSSMHDFAMSVSAFLQAVKSDSDLSRQVSVWLQSP